MSTRKILLFFVLFALFMLSKSVSAESRATLYIPQSSYPHTSIFVVQNLDKGPVPHHDILEKYKANESGTYTLQYSGQHYAQVNKNILILAWGRRPTHCGEMEGCNGFAFRIANPAQYTISTGNGDGVDITGITDH